MQTKKKYLTLNEVAKILGLSYITLWRYCFDCSNCKKSLQDCETEGCGRMVQIFKPINVGSVDKQFAREWRIPTEQVEKFLKDRRY